MDTETTARGEIMRIISDAMYAGSLVPESLADAILQIPEIKEALELLDVWGPVQNRTV